mgnify:CR=1 FL=1
MLFWYSVATLRGKWLWPRRIYPTENFVKIFKNKKQKTNNLKDSNIIALELSISNKIGLNVDIKNNIRNKGVISFEYKDLDQLNKIINIIKANY